MLSHAFRRLLWMIPVLFGVSLLTFLLLDLVPVGRAVASAPGTETVGLQEREAALQALRVRYGLVDPDSGEELGFFSRYGRWLSHAARLDFAPPGESAAHFRSRLSAALLISLLLGLSALSLALLVGVTLGSRLGARVGSRADRLSAGPLLALGAQPEFLIATLLLLACGGALGPALFPAGGLRSPGASTWPVPAQVFDFLRHLVLPVSVMALAPAVTIARYLRESFARMSEAPFARSLRALGTPESLVRRRVLRHALSPIWTLLGTMLPSLIAGSVVVEQIFALPGFGRMTLQAVLEREVSVVMATTCITALLVMLALLVSDLLHARSDPRVVLR